MWTNEHTITTDATSEQIWRVWSDVEGWQRWDDSVAWCKLEGGFRAGSTYLLKPTSGPAVKATIAKCDYLKGFSDVSRLPLARLEFVHTVTERSDGRLDLTHRLNI